MLVEFVGGPQDGRVLNRPDGELPGPFNVRVLRGPATKRVYLAEGEYRVTGARQGERWVAVWQEHWTH